jgi:NAD(P)-dependent dehydrogenase (short-subunit alcohol dehydrogenase family)
MEHDLVIGGSGMLADLVEAMARSGRRVSVVARGTARLQRLAARHPDIHPLALDYTAAPAFETGLAAAVRRHGPFSRCVAWMHDDSRDRALKIARQVSAVYCEVLGSASADPSRPERLTEWQALFEPMAAPKLRLAVLGFVVENGWSRWLTNAEISAGVGRALESEDPVTVVGTVTLWSARP